METRTKQLIISWLLVAAFFLVGVVVLGIYIIEGDRFITKEEDLTLAQGIPVDVDAYTKKRGDKYLKFTVASFPTEYSSNHPKYEEVFSALDSGKPIEIWISTKQETLFPRQGWYPLYKLSIGGNPVLTYAETLEDKKQGPMAILIIGCVILGIGVFGLVYNLWYQLWPKKIETTIREETPQEKAKRLRWIWKGMSFLIYGCLIGTHLYALSLGKMVVAFGPEPLGLPAALFVVVVDTILYPPMIWVWWHFTYLFENVSNGGRRIGIVNLIISSLEQPRLIISLMVVVIGIIYFGAVCGGWPTYFSLG